MADDKSNVFEGRDNCDESPDHIRLSNGDQLPLPLRRYWGGDAEVFVSKLGFFKLAPRTCSANGVVIGIKKYY